MNDATTDTTLHHSSLSLYSGEKNMFSCTTIRKTPQINKIIKWVILRGRTPAFPYSKTGQSSLVVSSILIWWKIEENNDRDSIIEYRIIHIICPKVANLGIDLTQLRIESVSQLPCDCQTNDRANLHLQSLLQNLHQFLWGGTLQVDWGCRGTLLSRGERGCLREEAHRQQQARRADRRRGPLLLLRSRLCRSWGPRDAPRRRRAAKRCVLAQQTLIQRLQTRHLARQPLVGLRKKRYLMFHLVHFSLFPVPWRLRRHSVLQFPKNIVSTLTNYSFSRINN